MRDIYRFGCFCFTVWFWFCYIYIHVAKRNITVVSPFVRYFAILLYRIDFDNKHTQTHTHIVPGTNDDCEKQITTRIKFNVCVSYLFFDSANNCSVVDINQRA